MVMAKGQYAREVARGARAAGLRPRAVICVEDPRELVDKLVDTLQSGDTILVKGSRANRMEDVVQELKVHYGEKD
jgi:UDP-N-acetylmuramoyl-tripeptide--D-alanyl-D-alanine ligase